MIITESDEFGVKRNPLEYKFVLVYRDDLSIVTMRFNDNKQTGTSHNIEVFSNAQDMADRSIELNLDIQISHMILAIKNGVELTEPRKSFFENNAWNLADDLEREDLISIGYTAPQ